MSFKSLDLTLLYVEDDDNARMRLTEVFKHKVENLYVAKDAIEALELFKKHYIHFIISDFQMPNMNGNELCSAIKKINPSVCFVLLTAYNDSNLLINAIDVGVDKFLQKPVNAKKLFNVIDAIYEKIMNKFQLEKSRVCLQEAEKIALLSYWD
ncbi:MAG: response regulator, partial [Campylobacterota bacterium]|nr:response regulator [Campylobacterota bacterium]